MASASSDSTTPARPDTLALVQRLDSALKGNPHLSGTKFFATKKVARSFCKVACDPITTKQMAQEALRNLEGVERIVNDLQVDWQSSSNTCTV